MENTPMENTQMDKAYEEFLLSIKAKSLMDAKMTEDMLLDSIEMRER